MRILLIGDQSMQNDAVKSILSSEVGCDIRHLTHAEVQDGLSITKKYLISLVDLISLSEKQVKHVRDICERKHSKYLIALHDEHYDELKESLLDAGADYCFSIDSEPEELIQVISRLN